MNKDEISRYEILKDMIDRYHKLHTRESYHRKAKEEHRSKLIIAESFLSDAIDSKFILERKLKEEVGSLEEAMAFVQGYETRLEEEKGT